MILTQADGTTREVSSDELSKMLTDAKRKISPGTPIQRMPPGTRIPIPGVPGVWAIEDEAELDHFIVDSDGALRTPAEIRRRASRRSLLRGALISVTVAALAGFFVIGLSW